MLRRRYCFCGGSPNGSASLGDLAEFLESTDLGFEGTVCETAAIFEAKFIELQAVEEELFLFLALPAKFPESASASMRRAVNQRAKRTVYLVLKYNEADSAATEDFSSLETAIGRAVKTRRRKDVDKILESFHYSDRESKAEFDEVTAHDLGQVLEFWRHVLEGRQLDLDGLLRATTEEGLIQRQLSAGGRGKVIVVQVHCRDHFCPDVARAVQKGHLNCVERLLLARADPEGNVTEDEAPAELSPLHTAVLHAGAARRGHLDSYEPLAKMLLEAAANPGRQTSRGITALHWAAGFGRSTLVEMMLKGTKAALVVNLKDSHHGTALHRAAQHGQKLSIKWLIHYRADCNLEDNTGCTPLHVVAKAFYLDLVGTLLSAKASAQASDAGGRTPLHCLASYRGPGQDGEEHQAAIKTLLDNLPKEESCLDSLMDKDSWTPAHEAALASSPEVLKLLRGHSRIEEPCAGLVNVPTPLHVAAMGSAPCLRELLLQKASPLTEVQITWDTEHFRIRSHYHQIGSALVKSGVLASPVDRCRVKTTVTWAVLQRNLMTRLSEFHRNEGRSHLKLLNTKDMTKAHFEAVYRVVKELNLRRDEDKSKLRKDSPHLTEDELELKLKPSLFCLPPREIKADGSREALIVYKERTTLFLPQRVLVALEFVEDVKHRLKDPAPEGEVFMSLTSWQRLVVLKEAERVGFDAKPFESTVTVRRAKLSVPITENQLDEKEEAFVRILRARLDSFTPGETHEMGCGASQFFLKLIHQEAQKRGFIHEVTRLGSVSVKRPHDLTAENHDNEDVLGQQPEAAAVALAEGDGEERPSAGTWNEDHLDQMIVMEEFVAWVKHEVADLQPGQSKTFSHRLNKFARRVVHEVAEELGMMHVSSNVPEPVPLQSTGTGNDEDQQQQESSKSKGKDKGKEKGKGKGKGRDKGKGKGKVMGWCKGKWNGLHKTVRQVTVTRPVNPGELRKDRDAALEEQIHKACQDLLADDTLREHPFPWASPDECRTVVKVMQAYEGLACENERQGEQQRVVLVKEGKEGAVAAQALPAELKLPDSYADCFLQFRSQLGVFLGTQEQEFHFPPLLCRSQRAAAFHAARDLDLEVERDRDFRMVARKRSDSGTSSARFKCDGCDASLCLIRFHCNDCLDFDLCQACYARLTDGVLAHDPCHEFVACDCAAVQAMPTEQPIIRAVRMTVLHFAAGMGHVECVESILQAAPKLLDARTTRGHTALHLACQRQRGGTVELLLRAAADCNLQDHKGCSPLFQLTNLPSSVVLNRDIALLARELLQARANVNQLPASGRHPISNAVRSNNMAMVKDFLDARADLDAVDADGRTPLHAAATGCIEAIIALLLSASADPWAKDSFGDTPLQIATVRGQASAVRLLARRMEQNARGTSRESEVREVLLSLSAGGSHSDKVSGELKSALVRLSGGLEDRLLTDTDLLLARGGRRRRQPQPVATNTNEFADTEICHLSGSSDGEPVCMSGTENVDSGICKEEFALRHALVMANGKYDNLQPDLRNAGYVKDAVANTLERLGFKVEPILDATKEEFVKRLDSFCEMLNQTEDDKFVLVYFVGHGVETGGELFCCLRDAVQGNVDVGCVLYSDLVRRLQAPNVAVMMVLDCCRDNPTDVSFRVGSRKLTSPETREGRGESHPLDLHGNVCVVWSTDPGTRIEDSNEESLGSQLVGCLEAMQGRKLFEVLDQTGEQIKVLKEKKLRILQRCWCRWGEGANMGERTMRPVLCWDCAYRRRGATKITFNEAEWFLSILLGPERCAKGNCAIAALLAIEPPTHQDSPLAEHCSYFCAAVRANATHAVRWMLHLRPGLVLCHHSGQHSKICHLRTILPRFAAQHTPALGIAARLPRCIQTLKLLLERRADLAAEDRAGWTAVHEATFQGNVNTLEVFGPAALADVMARPGGGLSAMHLAAAVGHAACLRKLIDAAAADPRTPRGCLDTGLSAGWEPERQHEEFALLKHMAFGHAKAPLTGLTPLHLAAAGGQAKCAGLLLAARASVNVDTDRGTPLRLCMEKWPLESKGRFTPGRLSEPPAFDQVFDKLLAAGAVAHQLGKAKAVTPLHNLALHWGSLDQALTRKVAERLMDEAGAPVDAIGSQGGTPLQTAATGRNWAVFSLLLERRADPGIRNDAGRTAADIFLLKPTLAWPQANMDEVRKVILG